MNPIEVNKWVEASQGIALVQKVCPLYFEYWQRMPDGCALGGIQHTMIIYKQLCDFRFKVKMRVGIDNVRLCNSLEGGIQGQIDSLLADLKVSRKFEHLAVPEDLGCVHSFVSDVITEEVPGFVMAVDSFAESHRGGYTYAIFERALPSVSSSFLKSYGAVPAGGYSRIKINMFNRMFGLNEHKERIFTKLSVLTSDHVVDRNA